MKYNLETALTFVKYDSLWIKKLFILSGVTIVSILLFVVPPLVAAILKMFNIVVIIEIVLCWLVGAALLFAVNGFCIQAVHERIFYTESKLPEWKNLGGYIILGFKSLLGTFMYYIPLVAIGFAVGFNETLAQASGNDTSMSGTSFLVNSIYNLLYFIFMFFYFAFNANFLKDFNVFSYINVSAAYRRIKGHFVQYTILIGLILALGVVLNLAGFVLCITIIGIILLPLLSVYVQLVILDFQAQFIRITENK